MSNKLLNSIGLETTKGELLHGLAQGVWGAKDYALLVMAGNVVDQETFTLGSDVYELHQINTDTTVNTANSELDNTDTESVVTLTGVAVGAILLVESEFMQVTEVGTTYVKVSRGYAGSTIAAHADAEDIYKAAQAVGTGNIPVPLGATLTLTAASALIETAVNAVTGNALTVTATELVAGTVAFTKDAATTSVACAETLTNGTISAAFVGGVQPASRSASTFTRAATSADVTAGSIYIALPFTPSLVTAAVYAAAGTVKAWDGAVTIVGDIAEIDNSGSTDFADTDIVVVSAYE